MANCTRVIERALLKLGVRAAGQTASAGQSTEALSVLQSLYTGWINGGLFGRARDVYVTGDYTAEENDRVTGNPGATITVTVPETIDLTSFDTPAPGDGASQDVRTPRDGAFVIVNDGESTVTYLYDAYLGRWAVIEDLALTDSAPLSNKDLEGLSSCLALELLGDYPGTALAPTVARSAARFKTLIASGHGSPRQETQAPYF